MYLPNQLTSRKSSREPELRCTLTAGIDGIFMLTPSPQNPYVLQCSNWKMPIPARVVDDHQPPPASWAHAFPPSISVTSAPCERCISIAASSLPARSKDGITEPRSLSRTRTRRASRGCCRQRRSSGRYAPSTRHCNRCAYC